MRKPLYILSMLLLLGACRTGAKSSATGGAKFKAPAGDSTAIIAGFDTLGVTKGQIDKLLQPMIVEIAQQAKASNVSFDQAATQMRRQAAAQVLMQAIFEREVKANKIVVDERKVDSIYKAVTAQFKDSAQLLTALAQAGDTPASVREKIAKQLLHNQLLETVLADSLKVSPARIDSFYQANMDRFGGAAKVRGRHILKLSKGPEDSAKAHGAILAIAKKLSSDDKQFGAIAKAESDDPGSKANGGDLGWFNPKEMVPEFAHAVETLEPGKISAPVRTQYGWHIIQIQDRKAGSTPPLDSVKPTIEAMLKQEVAGRVVPAYYRKLAKTYKVEFLDASYKDEIFEEPKPAMAPPPAGMLPEPAPARAPAQPAPAGK
ncbi:MAG: peptidylprolyl isomerase [Fibrobacteres bacterium]|nr:peptidylprolyl isomerase [Fibrobacterota bacterium]